MSTSRQTIAQVSLHCRMLLALTLGACGSPGPQPQSGASTATARLAGTPPPLAAAPDQGTNPAGSSNSQLPLEPVGTFEPFKEVRGPDECLGNGTVMILAGTTDTFLEQRRAVVKNAWFKMQSVSDGGGLIFQAANLKPELDSEWTLEHRVQQRDGLLEVGREYRAFPPSNKPTADPSAASLYFPGQARYCGDRGKLRLSEYRRVGKMIASATAQFGQHCVNDPDRELTGCFHYENALLLQVERDLQNRELAAKRLVENARNSGGAHDPRPCSGARSLLTIDGDAGHDMLGPRGSALRSDVLDQPEVKVIKGQTRSGGEVLEVTYRQRTHHDWQLTIAADEPLAKGQLLATIGGYAKSNARITLVRDASSCTPGVARALVHELTPERDAGLITLDLQCNGAAVVRLLCALRGRMMRCGLSWLLWRAETRWAGTA